MEAAIRLLIVTGLLMVGASLIWAGFWMHPVVGVFAIGVVLIVAAVILRVVDEEMF